MFELFILWLICGAAAAYVAHSRGAGGCGWAIVGFLLGPLGFVLAFTAGVKCETCGKTISEQAKVCPYCGRGVPGKRSSSKLITCRQCGQFVAPSAIACPHCGRSFRWNCVVCGAEADTLLDLCPRCGKSTQAESIAAPPTKQCPFCAEKIHRDAVKCKHCGEFLKKSQEGSCQAGPHD